MDKSLETLKVKFVESKIGKNIAVVYSSLYGFNIDTVDFHKIFKKRDLNKLLDVDLDSALESDCDIFLDEMSFNYKNFKDTIKCSNNKKRIKSFDFSFLPRYKAKIDFVSPLRNRNAYQNIEIPFFGISLENSNFVPAKLLASLEWISKKYKKCYVLVGDSIHNITLKSREKISDDEAYKKAISLGQDFIKNNKDFFDRYRKFCDFKFILCSEIQSKHEYRDYYKSLKNFYHNDDDFRKSVRDFGNKYHSKKKSNLSLEAHDCLISSSSEYFLQEFAVFCCLYKSGLKSMIYPGSFSTLAEIAEGDHPGAPEELKNMTIISLHIKKRN